MSALDTDELKALATRTSRLEAVLRELVEAVDSVVATGRKPLEQALAKAREIIGGGDRVQRQEAKLQYRFPENELLDLCTES